MHINHAHRMRGHRWADDPAAHRAMQDKVPQSVGECYRLIEDEMFQGPYVMGDRCTISDFYLFTLAQWMDGDGVDMAALPKLHGHFQRMAERPSVVRAIGQELA